MYLGRNARQFIYDITQTAQAMSDALDMDEEVRAEMNEDLRDIARSRGPRQWLDEQLGAVPDDDSNPADA